MNATSNPLIWEETMPNGVQITYLCDRETPEIRVKRPDTDKIEKYYFCGGFTEEVIERIHKFVNF